MAKAREERREPVPTSETREEYTAPTPGPRKVRDVMSTAPATCTPDTNLREGSR